MARKSRKGVAAPETPQKTTLKCWQAALYIRLSGEFNGKRGDSLETQRQIMEAYIAICPDIEIVEIYTDNGATGRNFEREAFQRMLSDIEDGKIDCIVVKDLSRLGRNAIDTGYYIEKYFPLHGVRFIAVNDQFDTEDSENSGNHLIVPIKNMINEAYAADISKKARTQRNEAMRDGEFVGSRPPYGYRKDPDNCHHLLVNEDTAPIVQQIFQWAVDGVSPNMIARRLNESGVMTPGYYQASIGLISSKRLTGSGRWHNAVVDRMLRDEVYVGDMVQGKNTHLGKKQIPVRPEDWIVVRNTHEPIISREMFAKTQNVRALSSEKRKKQSAKIPYSPNILLGRIFCGHCGRPLSRHRYIQEKYYYRCYAKDRISKDACDGNIYVKEDLLFQTIIAIIRQKAEIVISDALQVKQCDSRFTAQKTQVDQKIAELQHQMLKARTIHASLYENFVKGILTRTEYLEMQGDYSQKVSSAMEDIQQLQTRQAELERQMKHCTSMAEKLAAIDKDTVLSSLLVKQLIEKVTVNGPDDISIDFAFESDFERVLEVLGNE